MGIRYLGITVLLFLPLSIATAQWQKSPDFPNDFFNEVQFVDNTFGWVTRMNATVSRTTDGGSSWQSSTLPNATNSYNRDICFVSRTAGFVSGEDGVWKTTNGGATWTSITPAGFSGGSSSIWFTDANTGVAGIGACIDSTVKFYRTTDGGTSWTSVQYTSTMDVAVGGIAYLNGTWLAAGGRGKLWRSNDGGATWTLTNTGSNGWQEDIITFGNDVLIASTTGSACGVAGGGTVLRSSNGGSTWTITTFASNLMWGVTRYSPTEGWTCGDGGLALKTTDGGGTWVEQSCGLPRGIRIDDINFTDATHGWAVGDGLYKLADASIDVSPDTIDFGAIPVGSKSADSIAKIRSFFPTLTTANARIAGTDLSQFGLGSGGVAIPVGVCSTSPAAVFFAPTSQGLKTAVLEVTVQGSPVRRVVVLRGRGIQGEISVMAKPALDTMVCGVNATDSILIRNIGSGPLNILGVRNVDSPGGLLQVVGVRYPAPILPGGALWLKVQATAYTAGSFESTLEILSDDVAHSPMNVRMRYYRRRFAAALSTGELTLAPTPVGVRTNISCIEYSNRGDATQYIDAIESLGGDAEIALIDQTFPVAVTAGKSVQFCFHATPSDTGWYERRFAIRTSPCQRDTQFVVRALGRSAIVRADTVVAMPDITCERASRTVIPIANTGNDTLQLDRPSISGTDADGLTIVSPATWPLRIAPNESSAITVELEPQAASATPSATLTFATNDRFDGRSTLRIHVSTTRSSAIARPTVSSVDVGEICIGDDRAIALRVASLGNADARVVSAKLLGATETVTSISIPPTGAVLPPGMQDSLTLRVAPVIRGAFTSLVEIRTEPCARIDTVSVSGTGVEIELASDAVTNLGTLLHERPATAKIRVRNDGNVAATISKVTPETSGRVTMTDQLPLSIPAGGFIDLNIAISTSAIGPFTESLHIEASAQCADAIDVDVSGIVVDAGGVSLLVHTSELRFDPLFECEKVCNEVELESVGEHPVVITDIRIEGASNSFHVEPIVSGAEIAPGTRMNIPVCYVPQSDDDVSVAELVLETSDTAMREVRIPLRAESMKGLSVAPELWFGVVADNAERDSAIIISNPSSRPLSITWEHVDEPFSVVTKLPLTIPAHGSAPIVVRARNVDAFASVTALFGTSHPCGDTLSVTLQALSDDRFVVTTSADTSVGRWGSSISVPIHYVDTTRARATEFTLVVTASSSLLEPRAVIPAPGIHAEKLAFDVESGALSLRIRSADGLAISSSDSLVRLEYEVLRGDAIATSIAPVITGMRPGIVTQSNPGAFMLEDYCDAHSRLLRTTGRILLMQNTPNPASTRTVIEFETSFDDNVVIAVFDLRGNEVKRILDERMPAGRRRIEVETSQLPAGTYTYRLLTGLQSLSRRLVITP